MQCEVVPAHEDSAKQQIMCRPPKATEMDADAAAEHWAKRALMVGLLRSISGMVLTPVVPGILKSALNEDQSKVAMYQADWIFYGSAIQLIIGPVCGAIGDGKLGRKPILVACALLQALGACAVLAAHEGLLGPLQLWSAWLLRQVATVAAMTTTSASISDAYAHDRTKIAKTAARLGGMQMGVGMLLGPALGATIASKYGPRGTGVVAILGGVLALLGQLLLVPEAGAGTRTKTEVKNPFVAPLRLFSEGAPLRYLACASLCQALCRGESAVYSPFMVDIWGAGPKGLALTMTVVGATFAASQALLVGPLVKKFGAAGALRLGYACSTLQRVIWSYYTYPGIMLLGLALGSPGFGADSIIQQLALEYHPSSTPPRGELAASFSSLGTLGVLASSKALGFLFAWGAPRGWPGAPFAVGAAASLCAFSCASLGARAKAKTA